MTRHSAVSAQIGSGDRLMNPNRPAITSELGTYGVVTSGGIEWEVDDHYPPGLMNRVRAAVDFLDMHPGLDVVVEARENAHKSNASLVRSRIAQDGLAGRYTCRNYGDNLVKIGVK